MSKICAYVGSQALETLYRSALHTFPSNLQTKDQVIRWTCAQWVFTLSSVIRSYTKNRRLQSGRCSLSTSISRKWRVTSRNNLAGHLERPPERAHSQKPYRDSGGSTWRLVQSQERRPHGYLDVYPDENEENLMSGHVRNFLTVPFDLISRPYALFSGIVPRIAEFGSPRCTLSSAPFSP